MVDSSVDQVNLFTNITVNNNKENDMQALQWTPYKIRKHKNGRKIHEHLKYGEIRMLLTTNKIIEYMKEGKNTKYTT